jgi:hypothetical protein
MAFVNPKVWSGTTGDLTLVTNWQQDNVRTAQFRWVASGFGTAEYYLQTAGGASVGLVASPPTSGGVYINGVAATKASVSSLAAGNWGYGDADSLGYDTIYVRLSDGTDPDTKVSGYVKFNQVPQTGETVVDPEGAGAISSNTDYSAITLAGWITETSNDNRARGSSTSPIRLTLSSQFIYAGGGQTSAYFDLTSSTIAPEIRSTAFVDSDEYGLYLAGTAATVVDIQGGSVGLGILPDQPFTCTTAVRPRGASVRCGIGSSSVVPLLESLAGTTEHENSIANIEVHGGVVRSKRAAAVSGAVTVSGGTWYEQSSGTKTSVVQTGGTIDATQDGSAVTWSAYLPTAGTLRDDTDRLTISSVTRPTAAGTHTWIRS